MAFLDEIKSGPLPSDFFFLLVYKIPNLGVRAFSEE